MADVYGNRWRNLGSLGAGAQGDVFRVYDVSDPDKTVFALKRLKRAERVDRFLQEIEALRRINHPNVMKIIDHSSTTDASSADHYYFVMPLARQGNLAKRVGLYTGNLDSVLSVAEKLAVALDAVHTANYVHRDIKPANILFDGEDHNAWLSDFGICHNPESELTKAGDVMGPRGFTAPELESGGPDAVSPACDIYSLGKVIYYLITGGVVIGRENLDASFQALGTRGERYRLLQILLSRMVMTIPGQRIQTAREIKEQLAQIANWEQQARTLALTPTALASIDRQQQRSIDTARIKAENEKIAGDTNQLIQNVSDSICAWLTSELEKVRSLMSRSGTYDIKVQRAVWEGNHHFGTDTYMSVSGIELVFLDKQATFQVVNVLKFFLCRKTRIQVTIGDRVQPVKPIDPPLALIPYFEEHHNQQQRTFHQMGGFLKDKQVLQQAYTDLMRRTGRAHPVSQEPLIARTYVGIPVNLAVEFKATEWPSVLEKTRTMFSEAISVAIGHTESDHRSVGP